jgi:hypothetical protein
MSFALPIALTLTALMLPIIALYVLKVRFRRIPVSTNLFWKQLYQEKPPRSLWQTLRHLLSMLLQLFFLLLIVLSIADPYLPSQLLQSRRIVLIIDNSASMRATDIAPTRLDAARRTALQIVNGLRFRDEAAVLTAGISPQVVAGMTGHQPTLRRAVQSIPFTDNSSTMKAAVELGRRVASDHPHGSVIVLTDACLSADEFHELSIGSRDEGQVKENDQRPSSERTVLSERTVPVEVRTFVGSAANLGITQLQVRRSLSDALGYEILVSVKNASAIPVSCRLELLLDDIPIDVIPLHLKPEEVWSRSLEKTSVEGGHLQCVLSEMQSSADPAGEFVDQLQTDNTAWVLLPARKIQPVFLITGGNVFLQKVFEANPLVDLRVLKSLPTADELPADAVIVIHGRIPESLPDRDLLIVDPVGNCDLWKQGELVSDLLVSEQDESSPLMRHVQLDNVMIGESRQVLFESPPDILAKSQSGEVVFASVRRVRGRCLVLAVNLERSDLAFRTVFPILASNVLNWYSGMTGEIQEAVKSGRVGQLEFLPQIVSSQSVIVQSPDGGPQTADRQRLTLRSPSGTGREVTVVPTTGTTGAATGTLVATAGPLDEAGIWSLIRNDTDEAADTASGRNAASEGAHIVAEVAVNLADERETDLRPLPALTEISKNESDAAAVFVRPLWFYLVLLACIVTVLEWFLYQRRLIS